MLSFVREVEIVLQAGAQGHGHEDRRPTPQRIANFYDRAARTHESTETDCGAVWGDQQVRAHERFDLNGARFHVAEEKNQSIDALVRIQESSRAQFRNRQDTHT